MARALRLFRRTANFFLILTLALLLTALVGIYTEFAFRLPGKLEREVLKLADSKGFQLDFEKLTFDFRGRLTLHSTRVRFLGTSSNFFEAKSISVRFNHGRLIFGELKPLEFSVRNARLAPSTGPTEEVWTAENISILAFSEGDDYDIKNAYAKVGSVYLSVSGRFPKSELENGGELLRANISFDAFDFLKKGKPQGVSATVQKTFAQSWDDFCLQMGALQSHAKRFTDPAVALNFNLEKLDGLQFAVRASADEVSANIEKIGALSSRNIEFGCYYNSANTRDVFRLTLKFRSPNWRTDASLGAVSIRAAFNSAEQKFSDIGVSFLNAQYAGMNFDAVRFGADELGIDSLNGRANFSLHSDGQSLLGEIVNDGGSLKINFEGSLSVREIFKCKFLQEIEELKMFEFREGFYLGGVAELNIAAPENVTLQTTIAMADANLFGIESEWLFGDLTYDGASGDLWARDTFVKGKEGWLIGGDAYQNLKNLDYRYLLKGDLRPMAIAHFMEPWWEEVFTDTLFAGEFPKADFSVIGRWGNPEQIYVYGSVYANDIMRHGVPFEHADLLVWVNPERIALLNVNIENEGRRAKADLDWVYYSKQLDMYDENRIYAVSTLNRKELIGVGGPKVAEAIEILNFDEAPEISIKLFMANPEKNPEGNDRINLDFFAPGITRVGKIALENFRFRGYVHRDDVWLDNMHFSIAKGAGDGEIFITKKDGKDWVDLKARISGARQDDFIAFLASLGDESPANGERVGLGDFDKYGIVRGEVELSGFPDHAETFKGKGRAHVNNPKLTEVNLLGMISRGAAAVGFPIASFDLKEASSPFEIENGVADFSDIVVTGPTARINAKAHYDFINDSLNASGIMSPFATMDASLISAVVQIVNPFMSVLEVNMKGKIASPDVSVSLKPLNIFRSDERIVRNIERRLDKGEEEPPPVNGNSIVPKGVRSK